MRLTHTELDALWAGYVTTRPQGRIPVGFPRRVCAPLAARSLATATDGLGDYRLTEAGMELAARIFDEDGNLASPGLVQTPQEPYWEPVRAGIQGWHSFDGEQYIDPAHGPINSVRFTRPVAEQITQQLLADQRHRWATEGEYLDYVPQWRGEELWLYPGDGSEAPGWRVGPDSAGYYVIGTNAWIWDLVDPRD